MRNFDPNLKVTAENIDAVIALPAMTEALQKLAGPGLLLARRINNGELPSLNDPLVSLVTVPELKEQAQKLLPSALAIGNQAIARPGSY